MTSRMMMSARVLIMVALVGTTLAQQQQQIADLPEVKEYKLHCIESSGITQASAKKLASGEPIPEPDQPTKCFVQCFFQKLRLVDESGVVQKDKLEKFLERLVDADRAKDYVKQCDIRRTNPCDTAYAVYDCYKGKQAKLF